MLENVLPFFCFIFFFFSLSFIDVVPVRLTEKQYILIYSLAVFVLIGFAGCRWSSWKIGHETWIFDYDSYHTIFNEYLPIGSFFSHYAEAPLDIKQIDIGYLLWNSVARLVVGDNYNLFLLLTNALVVWLLLKGFRRNDITNGIFFILFFYASRLYFQYNFTLVRQAIAIVIVWYALRDLVRSNFKKYYFFVFIAISFHFSAVICLFFPLLKKIRINTYLYFSLLIVLIFLGTLGISGQVIGYVLETVLNALGLPVADRLLKYLEMEGGSNLLNFVETVPFFYIVHFTKKELLSSDEGRLYYNMFFCFILMMACTMNFFFFSRFLHYMMISYFYLLSYYYKEVNNKSAYILLSLYCLVYSVRYIMIWFYDVPYSCFLFHL